MYVYARSPPGLRAIPRDPARSPRDPARSCADCAFVNIGDTILLLFMGPVLYKGRKSSHSHPGITFFLISGFWIFVCLSSVLGFQNHPKIVSLAEFRCRLSSSKS